MAQAHSNPVPIHSKRCCSAALRVSWIVAAFVGLATTAWGSVEIHSNGSGGGRWSEPSTWHGGQVPGSTDTVVIAMRDQVEFDVDDSDRDSCAALFLDPEALLSFRPGRDSRTLSVGGAIESYGTIRIDATGDRRARYTLRLTAAEADQRRIILREHASLLVYGHDALADEPNVAIVAEDTAILSANRRVMLDLHYARIHNLQLNLVNLDNSGGANERLNIIGNQFNGSSSLHLEQCDSPMLRGNRFAHGSSPPPMLAVSLDKCALVQLVDTMITGSYRTAVRVTNDTSSNLVDLRIGGARNTGLIIRGSTDTSLRTIRLDGANGTDGMVIHHSKCILENVSVTGFRTGFGLRQSRVQMADSSFVGGTAEDDGDAMMVALRLNASHVRLINSTIRPEEIHIVGNERPPDGDGYAEALQYLVVQAIPAGGRRGGEWDVQDLPRGLRVRVQTSADSGGVPAGRADPNVRNSPMPFSSRGLTALASSRRAITVRSWRYDRSGELHQAPFYDLVVEAPQQDGTYKTLVEKVIEPTGDWFRADLNSAVPTVEVTLP